MSFDESGDFYILHIKNNNNNIKNNPMIIRPNEKCSFNDKILILWDRVFYFIKTCFYTWRFPC